MKRICYIVALLCMTVAAQAEDELKNYPLDTINGEEVYKYEVEKSIGLYRIGVNFNVQQSDIVRLNPQLKERGLHFGEMIYVPTGRKIDKKSKWAKDKKNEVAKNDSIETQGENLSELPIVANGEGFEMVGDSFAFVNNDSMHIRTIELALMLPFESQQTKRSNNADKMVEFYQGVLLALYELQNDSTKYKLRVYDTERSERRINALCDSTVLDSVQGILGLVYPIQIERMAGWCEYRKIPLLIPFTDDAELAGHSQLIQFNATDDQKADSICHWIKKHNPHCVAVDVRDAELSPSIRALRKRMRAGDITYTSLALRDLMSDSATYALDRGKENLIILHSDKLSHVRLLLPHIEALKSAGYRVRIVSQYSWQKEDIRVPQIYTTMFTSKVDTKAYDELWSRYYANNHVSEAPRYDLLGYDLLHMLVNSLNDEMEYNGLQSNIRLQRSNVNYGWQNANVKVVEK